MDYSFYELFSKFLFHVNSLVRIHLSEFFCLLYACVYNVRLVVIFLLFNHGLRNNIRQIIKHHIILNLFEEFIFRVFQPIITYKLCQKNFDGPMEKISDASEIFIQIFLA